MNPDKIKAGRKLDALIAERIFGKVRCQSGCHEKGTRTYMNGRYCYAQPDSPDEGAEIHQYSTEYNAMEEVIEKIPRALSIFKEYDANGKVYYRCAIALPPGTPDRVMLPHGMADTLPLAVCRAALKAVEK